MDDLQIRLNQPLLKRIITLLPENIPIYLVGGAVRDALLNRQNYDLDFITPQDALKIARQLADDLGAAYFPLDPERKVARLVLKPDKQYPLDENPTFRVDFSTYQGVDLTSDLQGRDFTINAIAVDIHQLQALIDPTGGAVDLIAKRLRACSPSSFLDDPVRILRAVRFSVDLDLRIMPDTLRKMKDAVNHLPEVSPERVRDELFRILAIEHPATSLRLLDKINVLLYVLPDIRALKDVKQSAPHVMDVWDHTLDLLNRLESLLDVLKPEFDSDKVGNLILGLVVLKLGRYRGQLAEHLSNALNPDRPHRALLFLAGIYHDIGKKATHSMDEFGKIRFLGHEHIGSKTVERLGKTLRLSNLETDRLVTIVNHHMRPAQLSHTEEFPSRKAVHHFFRDTGAAGVDICILSLADMLATYGPAIPQERWARHLEVVRTLLSAWWDDRDEQISPPTLVNGDDLKVELHLDPGPILGYLLESIRDAQINGEIKNQNEAINLARKLLLENNNKKNELI